MLFKKLIFSVKKIGLDRNKFIQSISWLGISQVLVRIFRLGTTVVLARVFSPHDYGLVSIIYTVNGFAQIFANSSGISANIVTVNEEDLEEISNTTYWINWILCISVVVIQISLAFPIAWFYNDTSVVLPICALSLIYLIIPFYKVSYALIQRENRLKIIALGRTLQAALTNIMTIGFALLGLGVWSVTIAMIISTPALVIIYLKNHSWQLPKNFTVSRWKEIVAIGGNMLSIDLMDRLRFNIDYIIVGRFLGVDALGFYFFAFNAGLGISLQVINAMTVALLPYLSSVNADFRQIKSRFMGSLKSMTLILTCLVLLQSSLAPFYVPIIFGSKWSPAIPILITICLSAIPVMIYTACYQLLVAMRKMRAALIWNFLFTLFFGITILIVVNWGIFWVAVAVLLCHFFNGVAGLYLLQYGFYRNMNKGQVKD
jgi:O-antigen/teichoic acid export membrane protein